MFLTSYFSICKYCNFPMFIIVFLLFLTFLSYLLTYQLNKSECQSTFLADNFPTYLGHICVHHYLFSYFPTLLPLYFPTFITSYLPSCQLFNIPFLLSYLHTFQNYLIFFYFFTFFLNIYLLVLWCQLGYEPLKWHHWLSHQLSGIRGHYC